MKTKTLPTPVQARDTWAPLPRREWLKRLHAARARAVQIIANAGLDLDRDGYSPCDESMTPGGAGDRLMPSLAIERARFQALVETATTRGADLSDMGDALTSFEIAIAESAYLFGVIAGSQVPWSVIEAMDPPHAPAAASRLKGRR